MRSGSLQWRNGIHAESWRILIEKRKKEFQAEGTEWYDIRKVNETKTVFLERQSRVRRDETEEVGGVKL